MLRKVFFRCSLHTYAKPVCGYTCHSYHIYSVRPFSSSCTYLNLTTKEFYGNNFTMKNKKKLAFKLTSVWKQLNIIEPGVNLTLKLQKAHDYLESEGLLVKRNFVCDVMTYLFSQPEWLHLEQVEKFCAENNFSLGIAEYAQMIQFVLQFINSEEDCEEYKQKMMQLLQKLTSLSDVFDCQTSSIIAKALCHTHQWKEAQKFLSSADLTNEPNVGAYTLFLSMVLNNQEIELFHSNLSRMLEGCQKWPYNYVFMNEDMIKMYLKAISDGKSSLDRLLATLVDGNLFVLKGSAEKLASFILKREEHLQVSDGVLFGSRYIQNIKFIEESEGVQIKRKDFVSHEQNFNSAFCSVCHQPLKPNPLTPHEFELLRSITLDRLLLDNDIYRLSTPTELSSIQRFMQQQEPFDYIIDVLNVYFRNKERDKSLYDVLNQLHPPFLNKKDKPRILLLTRKYFLKHYNRHRANLEKMYDVTLLTTEHSKGSDDIYMLICSMMSGYNTYIISSDTFSDHCDQFKGSSAKLFKKWQLSRQILFTGTRLKLQLPMSPSFFAHKTEHGYHVPYMDYSATDCLGNSRKLLCVHPTAKSKRKS